ncbi:hypothetical protein MIMGU_mgv11b0237181mg, partial [Erythranthe guttata]
MQKPVPNYGSYTRHRSSSFRRFRLLR